MIGRRSVVLACMLLSAAGATGCSGGAKSEPAVLQPATQTPAAASVSVPGTPQVQTSPPSATQESASPADPSAVRQQVAIAARRYYEAVERAYQTLDTNELEALSTDSCRGCQQQIAYVREAALKHHRHLGGDLVLEKDAVLGDPTTQRGSVSVQWSFSGMQIVDSAGKTIRSIPRSRVTDQVDLVKKDGSWYVNRILGLKGYS